LNRLDWNGLNGAQRLNGLNDLNALQSLTEPLKQQETLERFGVLSGVLNDLNPFDQTQGRLRAAVERLERFERASELEDVKNLHTAVEN
jgi:hypothetical protein